MRLERISGVTEGVWPWTMSFPCSASVEQELVSDVQKIVALLTVEGHARPYSGMTEEIIADRRRGLEESPGTGDGARGNAPGMRLEFF